MNIHTKCDIIMKKKIFMSPYLKAININFPNAGHWKSNPKYRDWKWFKKFSVCK